MPAESRSLKEQSPLPTDNSYRTARGSMLFESPSPGCSEPEREAVTIAERKQRLISFFNNVAEISAERMDELSGKASLRMLASAQELRLISSFHCSAKSSRRWRCRLISKRTGRVRKRCGDGYGHCRMNLIQRRYRHCG